MNFSLDNKHISITYHYVEDPSDKRGGIFPCSINEFERQIKFLSEHYSFASIEKVYGEAKKGGDKKMCAITFDDGLKDQYENALPILQKYNATATFFIMSGIYDGYIPTAHKIHILLSIKELEDLINAFNKYIDAYLPNETEELHIPVDISITDKRRHEKRISIKNFKEALSQLDLNKQKEFFKWFFKEYNLDEKALIKEFFMSREEAQELFSMNFILGNHTHNHPAFDSISRSEMKTELEYSQKQLVELFGKQPNVFCYPYGRLNKDSKSMFKVLNETNITHAVTTEPRGITRDDNLLTIPRYDTNDVRDFLDENNIN
ncbi:MAG: polysaccharide deacetylase family protein [Candidatus Pacebacteria bacterium]|nr:hypothetical protein [Parcubacteria group bacterium]MDP7367719.1 polysaccharide deacetylase family protein [Candidatus Paceibacterota bacterium]MDP7466463.1 polysaccharide deacetylase family protein [Candidatus Paceibacterota bacterium]